MSFHPNTTDGPPNALGRAAHELRLACSDLGERPDGDRDSLLDAVLRIGRLGAAEAEPRAVLVEAVHAAADAVPRNAGLSLSVGAPDQPLTVAPTGATASALDGLQLQQGEGPALDAWRGQSVVITADLGHDPRWPRLARREPRGAQPALAVPVTDDSGRIGVLTCYLDPDPGAGVVQVRAAQQLAQAVAGLVRVLDAHERLRTMCAQLEEALTSRAVIDQAKGIVMADRRCTADEAFGYLADLSQRRNVKLRDIAAGVVAAVVAGVPGPRRED